MRLSLTVFGLPIRHYALVAAEAEAAGYDAVWLADHLVTPTTRSSPYPYAADGDPGYDPATPIADVWVNAGSIASVTTRLRIGTGVYILPLRPVLATARAAATGAPTVADGAEVRFAELQVSPAADPPIPVVVGGTAPAALRRAARRGDAWYGPACTLAESAAARDRIEAERVERRDFTYYVRLTGPPEPATVARYADAGFDDVVVPLGPIAELGAEPLPATLRRVRDVADSLLG